MPGQGGVNRVVIIEDHVLFAEALSVALVAEGYDVERVPLDDATVSCNQLLSRVLRQRPAIVLLDLDLGMGGDAGVLVKPLVQAGVAVLVLTGSTDRLRWGECLRNGARAVLSKTMTLDSILETLSGVAERRPLRGAEERDRLVAEFYRDKAQRQDLQARLDRLTMREREVLGHLMAGRPVREIARRSYVSEATVRTQVKSILAKLEVTSQLAAVGAAHATHWKPPALLDHR
jgi:RNA polymerase sigma factor (sigma-70 family)